MEFKYRADHIGSFLRPQELLDVRKDPARSPDDVRRIEDQAILEVLDRQKDLGFQIFTDGEFRRSNFMADFYDSVSGLDTGEPVTRAWKGSSGGSAVGLSGVVVDKIRKKRRMTADETAFLRSESPGDIKMTIPTPNQFPAIAYKKGVSETAYPTWQDFLWDLVPLFRSEIRALVSEGVRYIEIDAPRYSYFIDSTWRNFVREELGVEPEAALDEAIRVDNACLDGLHRDGVVVAIHLCRGNNRSQWYAEGGYDPIAEKLFNELDVDAFLLEYESERSGTFEPLRFLPPDKAVVLGLVSSKVGALERQDEVIRRIDEASRYVPLENLALSPQCGFASMEEGNLLTEDEQWAKMGLVVRTARLVWGGAVA